MAHKAQKKYCLRIQEQFPGYFRKVRVLDIGSYDINGNNRFLFEDYEYLGIDLVDGPNVDLAIKAHELQEPDNSFDFIISTECFEHDMYYPKSLNNIIRMLKPGGLFLFTTATTGRREHGTRKTTPNDSPPTIELGGEWADYYKNLTEEDIRAIFNPDLTFEKYEFEVNNKLFDLYFYGIKK